MIRSLLYLVLRRILGLLRSGERVAAEAEVENAVLRHQVAVLRRQVKRPIYRASDKPFLAAASRFLRRDTWNSFLVRPETSSGGTGSSSPGSGPARTALRDGRLWIRRFAS